TTVQKSQQRKPNRPMVTPSKVLSRGQSADTSNNLQRRLDQASSAERSFFRSDRYFTVGHEWYASTREGKDIGPFFDRDDAEMALACHVTECFIDGRGYIAKLGGDNKRDSTFLELMVQELAACREQLRRRSEISAYAWAKQRLSKFHENPTAYDHVEIRARALKRFMQELDS
ncbi:MAG: DUF6316 family protein, partial [Sedimenticolaceae bacterium]